MNIFIWMLAKQAHPYTHNDALISWPVWKVMENHSIRDWIVVAPEVRHYEILIILLKVRLHKIQILQELKDVISKVTDKFLVTITTQVLKHERSTHFQKRIPLEI